MRLSSSGGTTRLTAALWPAQARHSVVIVKRSGAIYPLPRAIAYDHEVASILNRLGLAAALRPLVDTPGLYQLRNQHGEELLTLNWAGKDSTSGFAYSSLFSQPDMERVLNAAAQACPHITTLRLAEITHMPQEDTYVTATGHDQSGADVTLSGR